MDNLPTQFMNPAPGATPQALSFAHGAAALVWISDPASIEDSAREQIGLMASLPVLGGHLAIMPDCHFGKGATVGSVLPLDGAVIPNCVGVDIGCGMAVVPLGLKFEGELATREFWQAWLAQAHAAVPTGFHCHDKYAPVLDEIQARVAQAFGTPYAADKLVDQGVLSTGKKFDSVGEQVLRQLGTLGGGNHFLEVQRDEQGNLYLMVHSGSRATGLKLAEHYSTLAKARHAAAGVEPPRDLHWLELGTPEGEAYLADMQWAVDYALLNRKEMLRAALATLGLAFDENAMVNIPHNYAALETHGGKELVVHRKGATSARAGELGIIPGSMGSASYIVRGKGEPLSYNSCSHGAGRAMGRKAAKRALDAAQFAEAIAGTFSTPNLNYIDEAPMAYKDIDTVMAQQSGLVEIVTTLRPVITLKSADEAWD
jgi:tRNA-splicing ligase RtcB